MYWPARKARRLPAGSFSRSSTTSWLSWTFSWTRHGMVCTAAGSSSAMTSASITSGPQGRARQGRKAPAARSASVSPGGGPAG